jgi:hypothetical protein
MPDKTECSLIPEMNFLNIFKLGKKGDGKIGNTNTGFYLQNN